MHPIARNILALVLGAVLGGMVNMGIIMMSGDIIPPPNGADTTTMEGLKASMHLFEFKHFIFPFLAHALGTFVGAYLAARIAATYKMVFALIIGFLFLGGGITNVYLLPSPLWFSITDLTLAYIPMAYLGARLAMNHKNTLQS